MNSNESSIICLNSMLQGELAAIETYQQAIARVQGTGKIVELRRIHEEHREAANMLRKHIRAFDGTPVQGSGAWGAWAKLCEGAATLLGETAVLQALKAGEEQGADDYQEAACDEALSPDCQSLILDWLIPQTQEHVATLKRLLATK